MNRRDEILAAAAEAPFLPASLCLAAEVLHDPDVHPANKIRIVGHDPGLTANLLKLVNRNRPAGERVGSVRAAVQRLGAAEAVALLTSSGGATSCALDIDGYELSMSMHFKHSLTVGLSAVKLCAVLKRNAPETAFCAGLLAGVGKTVLGSFVRVAAKPIMRLATEDGLSFDQAEERVLGVTHAEVGGALLEAWNFPSEIVDAVRHHLRPEVCPRPSLTLDLTHFGNAVAKMMGVGLGVDGLNYTPSIEAAARLGLTPELVDVTSISVMESLTSLLPLFGESPDTVETAPLDNENASEIW